jgi:hypothetical protein
MRKEWSGAVGGVFVCCLFVFWFPMLLLLLLLLLLFIVVFGEGCLAPLDFQELQPSQGVLEICCCPIPSNAKRVVWSKFPTPLGWAVFLGNLRVRDTPHQTQQ